MYFFYKLAFIDFAKDFHCFFTFMKLAEFFLRQLMSKSAERPLVVFLAEVEGVHCGQKCLPEGKLADPVLMLYCLGMGWLQVK